MPSDIAGSFVGRRGFKVHTIVLCYSRELLHPFFLFFISTKKNSSCFGDRESCCILREKKHKSVQNLFRAARKAAQVNSMVGSFVWVEDPEEAWMDGEVVEVNGEEITVNCASRKAVVAKASNVFPKDPEFPPCGRG
ncbi:hypothetical protein NC652_021858 [Populus alba x Populus x berolinensis]|nr:hypothetical protein NC652_021858 [Populus alba x Populus x berolinensis]